MAYLQARECFDENNRRINPSTEHVTFNINNGLFCLTGAIEKDMAELKNLLIQILKALKEIKD